jgi:hypothetical protein
MITPPTERLERGVWGAFCFFFSKIRGYKLLDGAYPPYLYRSILQNGFAMFCLGVAETRPRVCKTILQNDSGTLSSDKWGSGSLRK